MSSESIVTALFLISAVIAAGVLISAIFPAIYRTADTFGSVSHESDVQMRTDIKIVNTFSADGSSATIWLKNLGTTRIGSGELDESDIFIGPMGNFDRLAMTDSSVEYTIGDSSNTFWDPGETLEIVINPLPTSAADDIYFAIVLSNGVKRSIEFSKG